MAEANKVPRIRHPANVFQNPDTHVPGPASRI
jgi:hypothetical protein